MKINNNKMAKKVISFLIFLVLVGIVYSCNQEISVSPPDAPPPHGYVLIDSKPDGAQIYLDGKNRRRITPDSLTWLETDTYTITLKKELFRDTSISIDAVDGERKEFFIDYTKNPAMRGEINCNGKPDGSEIFLNDSATGKTTPDILKSLLPGYYKVRYHAPNYRDNTLDVVVSSSNTSEAKTQLVDTTKWMDLNTNTSNIPTNNLTDITVDDQNNLWIGTEDNGLVKYDGNTWQIYSPGTSIIQDSKVNTVNYSIDGTVWAGTKFGLFLLKGSSWIRYNDIKYGSPLAEPYVVDIVNSIRGDVYVITHTIILNFFDSSGTWKFDNSDFRPTDTLSCMAVDMAGKLYFGTKDAGLYAGDNTGVQLKTTNSNILGNSISAIAADPSNGVWIGYGSSIATGTGIDYYNGSFEHYYVIPSNVQTHSIYADNSGMKWIGTNQGLITFTTATDAKKYNKETTGLEMNDVRGVVKDKLGRTWIATFGGGLILKKK